MIGLLCSTFICHAIHPLQWTAAKKTIPKDHGSRSLRPRVWQGRKIPEIKLKKSCKFDSIIQMNTQIYWAEAAERDEYRRTKYSYSIRLSLAVTITTNS